MPLHKTILVSLAATALAGCDLTAPTPDAAVCVLRPVGESGVTGTIRFTPDGDQIRVAGEIRGLAPGEHGFHVHRFGDLRAAKDGSSAAGHFAPEGHDHGSPDESERHVGDLGNIRADESGVATVNKVDGRIALTGEHSILGRAIVVHADEDSFAGASGDAGARVAFGVIGRARGSR